MDTLFDWSHPSHVTIYGRKQDCMYHACICEPQLEGCYVDMDIQSQAVQMLVDVFYKADLHTVIWLFNDGRLWKTIDACGLS